MIERFVAIYQHLYSWVCTGILFATSFLGDGFTLAKYICLVSAFDLIFAIIKSYKMNQGILSHKLVRFIGKTTCYMVLLIAFAYLDKAFKLEDIWFTRFYSAVIIFSEIWSCLANIVIIFPDVPIFKTLQKLLASEIANKLGTDSETLKGDLENGNTENTSKETLE